jgi:hypothetical protein
MVNPMTRTELITRITDIEWKMFREVPNIGGKAPCQDERPTFEIMRKSQAESWSVETLESYLEDLVNAEKSGKNLLTEKYARMMQSTSPLEYEQIKHMIPVLEPAVISLINDIMTIVLQWEDELLAKYPSVLGAGRPIHSSDDTTLVTSMETYLRSELGTYSLKTLKSNYKDILKQKKDGTNGAGITLEYTVKQYGYKSPEEANEVLKKRV